MTTSTLRGALFDSTAMRLAAEAGARSAPALETYANNSSPLNTRDDGAVSARQRRYHRRGVLWDFSYLPRVRSCGRVTVDARGVGVRRTSEGIVGFSGLSTCGSVWADPVCNAKVMARRSVEIGAAVTGWQARGGSVVFTTLTMRHYSGQSLSMLWDALAYSWGKVTSGKQWLSDKERFGVEGWLRVVEVTVGKNGWHVHIHALLFLHGVAKSSTVQELHDRMFGRWSRALRRRGHAAPLAVGQDGHVVKGMDDGALSAYLTKARDHSWSMGRELTDTQSKQARSSYSTLTPWDLLTLMEETGDAEYLDLWHEWEHGSKGRRQIGWSKGLRALLELGEETSDDEVASEVAGDDADTVVFITPAGWRRLRQYPANIGVVLDVLERKGQAALRELLDELQIEYEEV